MKSFLVTLLFSFYYCRAAPKFLRRTAHLHFKILFQHILSLFGLSVRFVPVSLFYTWELSCFYLTCTHSDCGSLPNNETETHSTERETEKERRGKKVEQSLVGSLRSSCGYSFLQKYGPADRI